MHSALDMRSPYSLLGIEPLDGAVRDRDVDATAFPHRRARFSLLAIAVWDTGFGPDEDQRQAEWAYAAARVFVEHTGPHICPAYVEETLEDWGSAHFGANFARLLEIKRRRDPEQRFRTGYPLPPA